MANYTALAAGDWNDQTIWFDPLATPPTPAGPPGAGDIVAIQVSGVFTGDGAVQTVMLTDASVTFTGHISTSSDFDLSNVLPATPMVVTVSGSGISAGHQVEVGSNTTLATAGNAQIVGPNSGTIGIQDFGLIVLNGGSISTSFLKLVGTLDLANGAATIGTIQAGAPVGAVGSLAIASAGSLIDTFGTVGMVTNGTGIATVDGGHWDNQFLTIGVEGVADVTVSNGGIVTVQGGGALGAGQQALMIGVGPFAQATLTVDGGSVAVTGDMGVGQRGAGTVDLAAGGDLTASGSLETGGDSGGVGDFAITGGVLSVGGNATLGEVATGIMMLSGGTVSVGGTLMFGAQTTGTGTLTLSGGSALVQADEVVVGGSGVGIATLGDQTEMSTTDGVIVGLAQGGTNSSGSLTLMSGSSLSDGGNLTVGDGGTGTLAVDGGSLSLLGSAFIIGNAATGNGDVSIQNSAVSVLGTVTIGNAGRAGVSVNTSGGLTATSIMIGSATGGNGGLALDGSGSSVQSGDITIGASGVGGLQVTNAAALGTSGDATIASNGGPVQQTATVDTKASWQIGGMLEVGLAGSADLAVQGAGQVAVAQVIIGGQSSADGTIAVSGSVDGIASALSCGASLVIGDDGAGTLQVTGGASIGPGIAGTGTVEIGALSDGAGVVALADAGSRLDAAVLTVGGDAAAIGGSGTLEIDTGATVAASVVTVWQSGVVTLAGGALVTDPITLDGALAGFGTVGGAVSNAGAIVASSGTLALTGALSGGGGVTVDPGATLRLALGAASGETIGMAAGGATLVLDELADTKATIAGFVTGDTIQVNGVSATDKNYSAGVLTLTAAGNDVGSLEVSGNYMTANFTLATTGSGVEITVSCFAGGTRIATSRGAVAVEALRLGDQVVTVPDRRCEPIVWIGERAVNCRSHPDPLAVWPVRIAAGAFGPARPVREMFLSPDHAVFVTGVLVPVKFLINGSSIAQVKRDHVSYFHLELPRHEIILAEDLPVESYLATGDRADFSRDGNVIRLYPELAARRAPDNAMLWEAFGAAPLVVSGPRLAAARQAVSAIRPQRQARRAEAARQAG